MKTIVLILLVGFLVGCSSSKPLKKMDMVHETPQIIDQRENNSHTSEAFKSTLSSFMPMSNDRMMNDGMMEDMSWQQMLKDLYMDSNIMYYILFAISFITIGVLILTGFRNRDKLKDNSKFNI